MNRRHVLLASAAAIAAGGYMLTRPQGGAPVDFLVSPASAQDTPVDTSTIAEMRLGNADAAVTLIEYASYTCPHCARFHEGPFKQLKADYIDTGKINFIYREVYFDRYGLWASMIARCGGDERFFGISDMIYAQQQSWAQAGGPPEIADALRKIGLVAGVPKEDLEACLQDRDMARTLVAWYQENAAADDINSTPSFVLNGEKYQNMSYDELSGLIEEALGNT